MNIVGSACAELFCELLKINTSLKTLILNCKCKKKNEKVASINKQFSLTFHLQQTDVGIGETGARTLSDALKANTTLTKLDLEGEG